MNKKETINSLKTIFSEVNNIDDLKLLKENFNQLFSEQESKLKVNEEAEKLETSSYLFIKESFENMSEELFKTTKGRKIIAKYINEHKSNKDLSKLNRIYENIYMADKTINVNSLIQEMKNLVGELNEKKINEGIKNLGAILKESYVFLGEKSKTLMSEQKELDSYVRYVFNNPLKMSNIVKYNACINEIKSFVDNNEVKKVVLKKNTKSTIEENLRKYNDLLNNENIDSETHSLLKEIKECENKEKMFEDYKNECLKKLDEAVNNNIEQSVCDKLLEFKNKILLKNYNEDTFGMDIANFIELKKLVEE